jgi:uncharacterized protein YdhG (YjbR/CyaY superfamily)
MKQRPASIPDYIAAAPAAGQAHLRKLHALLKAAAPKAQEAIKWGMPFFIEPRFLFAFSAHKAHLDFSPSRSCCCATRTGSASTRRPSTCCRCAYDQPLPEALIRAMARERVRELKARKDESFW